MQVKIQNAFIINAPILDENGAVVTDLATATNIYYMIKKKQTDPDGSALVTKINGGGITVDSPVVGTLKIQVDSPDTANIKPGTYYHAIQIVYSSANKQEVYLEENGASSDTITFTQDTIQS